MPTGPLDINDALLQLNAGRQQEGLLGNPLELLLRLNEATQYGLPVSGRRDPGTMTDADAAMGAAIPQYGPSPVLTDDQLAALMSPEAQAAYQAPSVEDIDALMHAARNRALADQEPLGQPVPMPEQSTSVPEPATAAPEKLSAQEQRAKALQEAHGTAGFVFDIDKKGQITITNTSQTREAAQRLSSPHPSTAQAPINFTEAMHSIRAMEDPVIRAQMMGQLQADAEVYKSQIRATVGEQAAIRLGVPNLEQMLAQNEALDRQDPRWADFQSDSPQTAKVRTQLMQARAAAEAETNRMLQSNISIAAIDAQLQAASQVYNRGEAATTRAETYQEQRKLSKEMQIEETMQAMSPEKFSRMTLIEPSLSGSTERNIATYIAKGIKDKDSLIALEAPEEALADLTFLAGNAPAGRVLVAKEAEATGKTPEEAAALMARINNDMAKPGAQFRPILRTVFRGDNETINSTLSALQLAEKGLATKAQQENAQQLRYLYTVAAIKQEKEARILEDVTTWGVSDVRLQKAIDDSKAADGTARAANVLKSFTAGTQGPEKELLQNQFLEWLNTAAGVQSKSLIAPVNAASVREQLIQEMNQQTIWEKLQELSPMTEPVLSQGAKLWWNQLSGGAQ